MKWLFVGAALAAINLPQKIVAKATPTGVVSNHIRGGITAMAVNNLEVPSLVTSDLAQTLSWMSRCPRRIARWPMCGLRTKANCYQQRVPNEFAFGLHCAACS